MQKTKRGLVAALNEMTETLRKTDFDLFLHYSTEHDGWRVKLGSGAESDERWKDAGTPRPLVDALREARQPLVAQFAQNARRREQQDLARQRRKTRKT